MIRFADPEQVFEVARVLGLTALAFLCAMAFTPWWAGQLYRWRFAKAIKRDPRTPIYTRLHLHKEGTPTAGGVIIWGTVVALIAFFWLLAQLFPGTWLARLDFLSRAQTLLPLGALIATAIVGLVDDYINVRRIGPFGGLRMRHRLLLYTAIALVGAWWFAVKLDWDLIHIPAVGDFQIGFWYVPFFIFVIVATAFSVNEADGLDGLAGGILLFSFAAYGAIAFAKGRTDLATFCGVIVGALLAFLWFNIPPARFFMGDTGAMSLGTTLGIIAMLTNSALVLPLIAFPLVLESGSVIIQLASRHWRGRKVFLSAPLHHHFEAKGWPEHKIVMRFWVLSMVSAAVGLVVGLLGMGQG